MSPLSRLFLWMAESEPLCRALPRLGFIRRSVRRFIPGEELDDALSAARELGREGLASVLTHLGEHVEGAAEAADAAAHYREVLDRAPDVDPPPEISVKLTHLGLGLDEAGARERLLRLVRRADATGGFVWIDMEESRWVEPTLRLFREARRAAPPVGLCLQAYLRRTPGDLEALLADGASVRLVKGAYREPADVALQEKERVDERYLALADRLLASARDDGVRHGIATHDDRILDRVAQRTSAAGLQPDAYEVQMLYGIRPGLQRRLAREGHAVRVLISYGSGWFPWFMRRLAERPANVGFVLRNLLPSTR